MVVVCRNSPVEIFRIFIYLFVAAPLITSLIEDYQIFYFDFLFYFYWFNPHHHLHGRIIGQANVLELLTL